MRSLVALIFVFVCNSVLAGEFYIGKDVQFHRMDVEPIFADNESYNFYAPQLNLYVGKKMNDYVSVEGGIYASRTLKPSERCKLNNYGVYVGLVGFVPVIQDVSFLGGISATHLIVHARHELDIYNMNSPEGTYNHPVRVLASDHETGFNPRLMAGAQFDLSDNLSIRASGAWENTAFMSSRVIRIFNSIHYSVGGLYRFE